MTSLLDYPPAAAAANPPRIVDLGPLLIAGIHEPMHEDSAQTIPLLWQKFAPFIGNIPNQIDKVNYGMCVREDSKRDAFYYMAGCAVWDFSELPDELSPLVLPSQRYAVFHHGTTVARIKETIGQAFDTWLPFSDYELSQKSYHSLHFFERYGEQFDPQTGTGDIEIWLPVTAKTR